MKHFKPIVTGLIAACFIFGAITPGWAAERKKSLKTKKAVKAVQTKKRAQKQRLPDLIVRDIRLIKNCKIKVTLRNIGGPIPDWVYTNNKVGVQMYKGGAPWGGIALRSFDSAKALKAPGGTASWVWFPGAANLNLGGGIHSIKVYVDHNTALAEANEGNNTLTRRLMCKQGGGSDQRKPDLIVRDIKLIGDCKIKVTLKNIGGPVPNWVYTNNNVGVQMYRNGAPWGGIALRFFDTAQALKTPGGMASWVWFPGAANLNLGGGLHTIKVHVDHNTALPETNEGNNTLTKRLKCRKPAERKPDLIVKDISLTSNCSIRFTVKNIGQAGVPAAAYANPSKAFFQMYDGSQLLGGLSLQDIDPSGKMQTPGGEETSVALPGNYTPQGAHAFKFTIDVIDSVSESNENNNSLTRRLRCP